MVPARSFAQVDVFAAEPYAGNPVAVVLDADGLSESKMQQFARWTNLSETTFVITPSSPDADYGLRIFTPGGELPFAGHPTLGSAHAWLENGGSPRGDDRVVQECGAGLVELQRREGGLSFRAPDCVRTGPLGEALLDVIARALGIDRSEVIGDQWVDNGPGWAGIQLGSAADVLAVEPDAGRMTDLAVCVIGAYPPGSALQFEVRAFAGSMGVFEDPVTGSANAGLAQWLIGTGAAPDHYLAGQGSRVGHNGVVAVDKRDDGIWVGGSTRTCVRGTVMI